jgi:hypothetical protein
MASPAIRIREVEEADAEALLALHIALDQETAFMLFKPGERSPDVELERERIRNVRSRSNQTLLVADMGNPLAFSELGVDRVEAETLVENRPALSLAHRLGMRIVGGAQKSRQFRGRTWDTVTVAILSSEWIEGSRMAGGS